VEAGSERVQASESTIWELVERFRSECAQETTEQYKRNKVQIELHKIAADA
jgi:hypothetical protein